MDNIAKAAAGAAGNGNFKLGDFPPVSGGIFKKDLLQNRLGSSSRIQAEEPELEADDDIPAPPLPNNQQGSPPNSSADQKDTDANSAQPNVSQGEQLEIEDRAKVWTAVTPAIITAYDKIQGFIALVGYDKIVVPSELLEELDALKQKYKDTATQTDVERKRMFQLEEELKKYQQGKEKYAMSVNMAEPIKEAITVITKEVVAVKPPSFNPIWMVVLLLLIQPVINFVTLLLLKYQKV